MEFENSDRRKPNPNFSGNGVQGALVVIPARTQIHLEERKALGGNASPFLRSAFDNSRIEVALCQVYRDVVEIGSYCASSRSDIVVVEIGLIFAGQQTDVRRGYLQQFSRVLDEPGITVDVKYIAKFGLGDELWRQKACQSRMGTWVWWKFSLSNSASISADMQCSVIPDPLSGVRMHRSEPGSFPTAQRLRPRLSRTATFAIIQSKQGSARQSRHQ